MPRVDQWPNARASLGAGAGSLPLGLLPMVPGAQGLELIDGQSLTLSPPADVVGLEVGGLGAARSVAEGGGAAVAVAG